MRMRHISLWAFCVWFFFFTETALAQLPELTDLAQKGGAAVVNVNTVKMVRGSEQFQQFFGPPSRRGTPFDEFFEQFDQFFKNRQGRPRKQQSLGSGFVISSDGFIVTNNHVIDDADEVSVTFQGGTKSFDAEIIGRDEETDLALLKIKADKLLPTLSFGSSEALKVGEWVLAIGNPFGLDHTVTAGIISAKGRVIGAGPYDNFLQTDASINPGNSGGPLLNMKGEVVGINTAIVASGQGIGFAIPSDMAKEVINQLTKFKKVKRGWLGVSIQDIDENTAKALGLDKPKGALIAAVQPNEPAEKAGMKDGDVVIALDGQSLDDASDLTRRVGNYPPGRKVRLTVWRKGVVKDLTVVLGERDMKKMATKGQEGPSNGSPAALGMSLRPLQPQESRALGLEPGRGLVITDVEDGSPAAETDVRPGDVILEANGQAMRSVNDFGMILKGDAKKKGVVMLFIKRRGQSLFRTIPLK